MKHLQFVIPGEPVGQGRPRFSAANGKVRTFDPDKSRNYKACVSMLAAEAVEKQGWEYTEEPVFVNIIAYMPVAKSLSKKAKADCYSWKNHPCKKPDVDNIVKGICDAMNGIVYKDDCQVCSLWVYKRFVSGPGTPPHVKVEVTVGGDANPMTI